MLKKLLYVLLLVVAITSCKKNEPDPENAVTKPEINTIQPKEPSPGEVVTVSGKGFGTVKEEVKLAIGSVPIVINTVSDTEIRFTLPENVPAGLLSVIIQSVEATIQDPQGGHITPKAATGPLPSFENMDPNIGKVGDLVTLNGTNFSTVVAENKVTFTSVTSGAVVTAVIKSASATALKVEVPAGIATGLVAIEVNGTSALRKVGFDGIFTLDNRMPNGSTGTIVFFDNEYKTNSYFASSDDQGNFFTLNLDGATHINAKMLRINAEGAITKTFQASDFVNGATTLGINGITNDGDGTIWVVTGLSSYSSTGKLFKIIKNTDTPVFVRDIKGGDMKGLDLADHFQDFVVNSNHNIFFTDFKYKIYFIGADGVIQPYINPWDLTTGLKATGLTIDAQDNLFFTAFNSPAINRIYKVSPTKTITALYQATEYGFADGSPEQARFNALGSIAVNKAGTKLYISDNKGFRLRQLDLISNTISTLAGTGKNLSIGSKMEGPALECTIAPAKISLSEAKKEIILQLGTNEWYQIYKY
ncbi:MAG: IPT/TIG domain-containing protein [Sporocytophaga sp.]|nr:IPT/TIG domain-containing protein [Sporocytophaga sp.]